MTARRRVGIVGASGYTGAELVRLLAGHPHVEITALAADRAAGKALAEVLPSTAANALGARLLEAPDPAALAKNCDTVFLALPHGASARLAAACRAAALQVVDLSADFRLRDTAVYERWYGHHEAPGLVPEAVYGLPERHREALRGAQLIAGPGCYPTSVILALLPLFEAGLVAAHAIIADSKSGTSGAGRKAETGYLFCEVNESVLPYKLDGHRHVPEIEQELSGLARRPVSVRFSPHLVPMQRGILTVAYVDLTGPLTPAAAQALYERRYEGEAFVRVLKPGVMPGTGMVKGSNFAFVAVVVEPDGLGARCVCAIDNLVKGAAGGAIQAFNVACGFGETAGLGALPMYP